MTRAARLAKAAAGTAAACLLLTAPTTGALGAAAPSSPVVISVTALNGAFCTSKANCWVVGDATNTSTGATTDEVLHWNGTSWSLSPTPEPGGTTSSSFNSLTAVACASAASCLAVGQYATSSSVLNQVLRWNGSRWSQVSVPNPGGTGSGASSVLDDVRCRASGICYAVGTFARGLKNFPRLSQALRWNGRSWSLLRTPDPGGNGPTAVTELHGLTCTSAANCWAVGASRRGNTSVQFNLVLHWNGRRWSQVGAPEPGGTRGLAFNQLSSAYCTSAANCWAVGTEGASHVVAADVNQVLHWNGRAWSVARAPDPGSTRAGIVDFLDGVTCVTAADCWAVGGRGTSTRGPLNQALFWNGRRWSVVPAPDPGGLTNGIAELLGVRCASPSMCVAVGFWVPPGMGQEIELLRWNGKKWLVQ